MSNALPELPLLDDSVLRRVLCVAAHPDDLEYGTSAAVAAWIDRGVEVSYLLLTGGEAGMPTPPEQTRATRAGEQRAACAAVGVSNLQILDHPDGVLVYSLDLRRDIARAIRTFKPDTVVTNNWAESAPWGLNQADHRVAGLVTVDGIRDAGNPWVFPELIDDEGLEPWSVSRLLVSADDNPTHGVDVSGEPLQRGIASLTEHREYLAALPDHPAPADFLPQMTQEAGSRVGAEHAVLFRWFDM